MVSTHFWDDVFVVRCGHGVVEHSPDRKHVHISKMMERGQWWMEFLKPENCRGLLVIILGLLIKVLQRTDIFRDIKIMKS